MRSSGAWIRTTTASFKDSRPYQLDDAGVIRDHRETRYANIGSGIWESNPSVRFGRPVPLPLGQSRIRVGSTRRRCAEPALEGWNPLRVPRSIGAVDGARTRTQRIKSPLLCHSSYDGDSGCGRNRTFKWRIKNPLPCH